MRYQSSVSYTYVLLSLWTSVVRNGGSVSGHTNDYLASTLRRMQVASEDARGIKMSDRRERKKSCVIDGNKACTEESTYYMYKDFEGGVTFAEAIAAPGLEADLEGCALAPIYSYDDLLEISYAIPPCKAAYTAAYKDPIQMYGDARSCVVNDDKEPYNCDFESLGDTLEGLWGENVNMGDFGACSLEEWFADDFTSGRVWCPTLKQNWVNYGSTEAIPSEAWRSGDTSYCGTGPIQNAAAAFATEYATASGVPIASLKALNSGEYLPGAVYKCCRDVVTRFQETGK